MTIDDFRLTRLILGLGLIVFCLGGAVSVLAHTELITAVPAPGELLHESPPEIRLLFSESIDLGSQLFLFTEGFHYIDGLEVQTTGAENSQLVASLPQLPPDKYNVQWQIISTDGHAISGSYTFRVAKPSSGPKIDNLALGLGLLIAAAVLGGLIIRPYRK